MGFEWGSTIASQFFMQAARISGRKKSKKGELPY